MPLLSVVVATAVVAVSLSVGYVTRPADLPSPPAQPPLEWGRDAAGRLAEPLRPLPGSLPLDAGKIALGRDLYRDRRLARDGRASCADCHEPAPAAADQEALAADRVDTPSLTNSGFNFRQFWNGRAATLEEAVDLSVREPAKLGSDWPLVLSRLRADAGLAARFRGHYGQEPAAENMQHAIAEYLRSLTTPTRFDAWLRGDDAALTAEELEGYRLFKQHGCAACHQGVNAGGNMYQRFGVMIDYYAHHPERSAADRGLEAVTGRIEDRHVFKVPGLRNVARTAPYFHDASSKTLQDAVREMGEYQLGVELPEPDISHIVAFLRALDGAGVP